MKTSMILVHIPTNDKEREEKDKFYQLLQNILDETPRYDMLLGSLGAWNAEVVDQQQVGDQEGVVGKYGLQGQKKESSLSVYH